MPDFRETYDRPDGRYRQSVPAHDEKVLRELLVNALVPRPHTQRGDIFLNRHPDRLEVVNPGRLPLGVTPQTILHASRRRNALILEDLARDLGSAIGEVHRRVDAELARAQLKRLLADLVSRGELQMAGVKRAARYSLAGDGSTPRLWLSRQPIRCGPLDRGAKGAGRGTLSP